MAVISGLTVITPDGAVSTLAKLGQIPNLLKFGPATAEPSITATLVATMPQTTLGSGVPGKFTVTLSALLPTDVTVGYKIAGSAINGIDDASLSNTDKENFGTGIGAKTIKAGKTSATIKVKPLGDLGGAARKTVRSSCPRVPVTRWTRRQTPRSKFWAASSSPAARATRSAKRGLFFGGTFSINAL